MLLDYEKTMLNECMKLENYSNIQVSNEIHFKSKLGFIVDDMNTTCSNLLFSLIHESEYNEDQYIDYNTSQLVTNMISIVYKIKCSHLTIVVSPNCYMERWKKLTSQNTHPKKCIVLESKSEFDTMNIDSLADTIAIIMNNTIYDLFVNMYNDSYTFNRVIYYRMERLQNSILLHTKFSWFHSPYIIHEFNSENKSYFKGSFKKLLQTLKHTLSHPILDHIILKYDYNYSNAFINSVKVTSNLIRCNTSVSILTLDGLIDNVVMNCLNSEDIKKALTMLGEKNILSEQNIIKYMLSNINKKIDTVMCQINFIEKMKQDDSDKISRLENLNDKLQIHLQNAEVLRERIKSQCMCFICFEKMEIKTTLKCCSNSYCFPCMSKWLHSNKDASSIKCPICKKDINIDSHLITIDNDDDEPITYENLSEISDKNTKIENLQIFLKTRFCQANDTSQSKRTIVILCSYTNTINKIVSIVKDFNLEPVMLNGNIKTIDKLVELNSKNDYNIFICKPTTNNYLFKINYITDVIIFHSIDINVKNNILDDIRIHNYNSINVWNFKHTNE